MKRIPKIGDFVRTNEGHFSSDERPFLEVEYVNKTYVYLTPRGGGNPYTCPIGWNWQFKDEQPVLDWSKPIETVSGEDVQVLITDGPGERPVIGYIHGTFLCSWRRDGVAAVPKHNLRNKVPPPKAKNTFTAVMRRRVHDSAVKSCISKKAINEVSDTATWKVIAKKEFTIEEGEGMA